jgi:hypothetical protein
MAEIPVKVFKKDFTLKFEGMPEAVPMPEKKVKVEIIDEEGLKFTAMLSGKSWRKAQATTLEFEHWIGKISGQLSKGDDGLEILAAGIEIFENQRKPPKNEIEQSG